MAIGAGGARDAKNAAACSAGGATAEKVGWTAAALPQLLLLSLSSA